MVIWWKNSILLSCEHPAELVSLLFWIQQDYNYTTPNNPHFAMRVNICLSASFLLLLSRCFVYSEYPSLQIWQSSMPLSWKRNLPAVPIPKTESCVGRRQAAFLLLSREYPAGSHCRQATNPALSSSHQRVRNKSNFSRRTIYLTETSSTKRLEDEMLNREKLAQFGIWSW